MRRLTGWWLIDVDVREEALRGGVVGAEEEDVGEARCSVGFAGKSSGSPCDVERMLRVRWIGRRWTMA